MIFGLAVFSQNTFANTINYSPKTWTEVCAKLDDWVDISTQSSNWSDVSKGDTDWTKENAKFSTIKRC